jgi:hypothetical protein
VGGGALAGDPGRPHPVVALLAALAVLAVLALRVGIKVALGVLGRGLEVVPARARAQAHAAALFHLRQLALGPLRVGVDRVEALLDPPQLLCTPIRPPPTNKQPKQNNKK